MNNKNFTTSSFVFDKKSNRVINEANGSLLVENCLLTQEEVVPYVVGVSFPLEDGEKAGFKYGDTVMVYRPLEEIEKAKPYYRLLPLLQDHKPIDSNSLDALLSRRESLYNSIGSNTTNEINDLEFEVVGSVGDNIVIKNGALYNSLSVWTESAKELVLLDGKDKLSVGYLADYVAEKGQFNELDYDFKQTNIRCNHVTICYEGRCPSASVADSIINVKKREELMPITEEQKKQFVNNLTNDSSNLPDDNGNLDGIVDTIQNIEANKKITSDEDQTETEDSEEEEKSNTEDSEEDQTETEDSEEEEKSNTEDSDNKVVSDSLTSEIAKIEARVYKRIKNEMKQMAMDSNVVGQRRNKLTEIMGCSSMALDSIAPSKAVELALDTMNVKHKHLNSVQKGLVFDAIHDYVVHNEMQTVCNDSVNTNIDNKTFEGMR